MTHEDFVEWMLYFIAEVVLHNGATHGVRDTHRDYKRLKKAAKARKATREWEGKP